MNNLGKLVKLELQDIRKIWSHEEKHLSPWIADNIESLNDILNLQIEIEGREEFVHNFRIDLTGTENTTQMPVVIENQFGPSDHDHLGKLITYSAAKEAGIMIWIASEIQLAHRAALEWLNNKSPTEMTFYGIELEVFKIDNSLPAPNFRIVAGPPPYKRKMIPDQMSPKNKKYLNFFNELRNNIIKRKPNFTKAKAMPQSWWSLSIGKSGFSVAVAFTIDGNFRVELYIDTGTKENNDIAFSKLKENSLTIQDNIGKDIVWDPLPDRRACRIYLATNGTIDDDEKKLTELTEWAAPMVIKFKEVFSPLVKNIQIE